ncbi:phosphoribulokinase [Ferrimicrobium sp.]|uniref:phosphoribulokinase n=1 Tax=Ferrimicrobium sp. TaxID=2926050 RepID=UPI00262D14C6|nr:phosphoribulokinase [Ferrimicrobium sp.]
MPHRIAAIQKLLATQPHPERVAMLAIAGDSASGKTTLTKGLVQAIGEHRISSFCTDDYHRYDRTERKSLPFTPLNPECNYLDIMEQHLQLLTLGQPILKPKYHHADGSLGRPELFTPREIVIVEGLFPLWSRLSRATFDVTAYLDPPEPVRREWKIQRDVAKRGYTEEQVLADLDKREPESEKFIRPQRAHADIVISFAPVEGRKEISATILLRPTVPHPDIHDILTPATREAAHIKLIRDQDGKPVDALHVHGHAPVAASRLVEEKLWEKIGLDGEIPESLGVISPTERSAPLAVAQLILLHHMIHT